MATALGQSPCWVDENYTNEELIKHGIYLSFQEKQITKADIYLARIAFMLSAGDKGTVKDFIIGYEDKQKPLELSGKDLAEVLKGAFGIKTIKNKKDEK